MKALLAPIFILAALLFSAAAEHQVHIPMIYFTPTETPTPPPTPVTLPGYDWVFVGAAFSYEPPETLLVYGLKPGFCYDILHDKNGSVVNLWAQKTNDCNPEDWHGQDWPPPEFPIPATVPPEFDYGEIFKIEIPVNTLYFLRACSDLNGCVWAIERDPP